MRTRVERGPAANALQLFVAALLCLAVSLVAIARHHRAPPPQSGEPGQFDYYLLTLSWSPTYCLIHPEDGAECGGKGYGFILHGLWPQLDSGGYPENCAATGDQGEVASQVATLSPAAEAVGRTVFMSPKLMRHEWQRHGTCSGLEAATYFRTADKALASVHIPRRFSAPATTLTLTSEQIAQEFHAANPSIPEHGLTVACTRAELSEVRVCLTRDLQFRSCGRRVRNGCPSVPIEVPASR
jgi:ribonuclease T2